MRPALLLRAALPLALALPACDQNPFDAAQVPTLAVATGPAPRPAPVFTWTPGGAWFFRVFRGPSTLDGLAPITWAVVAKTPRSNGLSGPITYGVVPATADENVPVQALVAGQTYTAELVRFDPKGKGDGFTNTANTYRDTVVFVAR